MNRLIVIGIIAIITELMFVGFSNFHFSRDERNVDFINRGNDVKPFIDPVCKTRSDRCSSQSKLASIFTWSKDISHFINPILYPSRVLKS